MTFERTSFILEEIMFNPNHRRPSWQASFVRSTLALIAPVAGFMVWSQPVQAAGDLLVAPTRVVLDSRRGTQVILNNSGKEEATYRISLVLRRMTGEGKLDEIAVENANDFEKLAMGAIRFAPKRVTLPPGQPQAIRLGTQGTETLPDGEYRAHMLFQAIPKPRDVSKEPVQSDQIKIQLIPIYGITIPILVRKGALKATAAIANARLGKDEGSDALLFDLQRQGNKSVFGEIRVTKAGQSKPLVVNRAIGVYTEIGARKVAVELSPQEAAQLKGSNVTIGFYEASEAGGGLITEVKTALR
jgi:P pilus assembly chaperone PapD